MPDEPDEIGKAHPIEPADERADTDESDERTDEEPRRTQRAAGSERARDEERDDGGPRYGGQPWRVADERGNRRFGHARNDDADPSELSKGKHSVDDDEWPGGDASLDTDATGESDDIAERTSAEDNGTTERGPQQAGFGRGEKPMKSKARTKKRPSGRR